MTEDTRTLGHAPSQSIATPQVVPMCLRCGTVTNWQVGPLLLPSDIIIAVVLFLVWGVGLVFLVVRLFIRSNPNNREKICPYCGSKNMWNFYYSADGAIAPQIKPVVPNQPAPTPRFDPATYKAYEKPANGTEILFLGVFSLLCFQILGPLAWIMGDKALANIDAGKADPAQRYNVATGRICGILSTCIAGLALLAVIGLAMLSALTPH